MYYINSVNIFIYTWLSLSKRNYTIPTFIILQILFQFHSQFFLILFENRPDIIKRRPSELFIVRIWYYFLYCFLNLMVYAVIFFILNTIVKLNSPAHVIFLLTWVFIKDFVCVKKYTKKIIYIFLIFYNFYFISVNIALKYDLKTKPQEIFNQDKDVFLLFFFINLKWIINLYEYKFEISFVPNFIFIFELLAEVVILDYFGIFNHFLIFIILIYMLIKRNVKIVWLYFLIYTFVLVIVPKVTIHTKKKEMGIFMKGVGLMLFTSVILFVHWVWVQIIDFVRENSSKTKNTSKTKNSSKKKIKKIKKPKKKGIFTKKYILKYILIVYPYILIVLKNF